VLAAQNRTQFSHGPLCRQDKPPMKPSVLRIERLLAKVEAKYHARPRRYCFYFDEEAEAKAQGLPYIIAPRVLSEQEWEKEYCQGPPVAG
jgi:hypothetical protein